jgi:hypothetical protein
MKGTVDHSRRKNGGLLHMEIDAWISAKGLICSSFDLI